MKNKIDIICYYDNHHKNLYDIFFYPTYKKHLIDDFNIISHTTNSTYETTGFQSKNWCQILIDRFDILKNYIKENNNKWAIFSDIDVVFLNNFYKDIHDIINNENNIDIFYMSESISFPRKFHINGGFVLFKCCDYIYDFFTDVQNNTKQMITPNDQIYISNFLKNNYDFRSSLLPTKEFIANNEHIKISTRLLINKSVKVFHATSTVSLIQKFQVLSSILCLDEKLSGITQSFRPRIWI